MTCVNRTECGTPFVARNASQTLTPGAWHEALIRIKALFTASSYPWCAVADIAVCEELTPV